MKAAKDYTHRYALTWVFNGDLADLENVQEAAAQVALRLKEALGQDMGIAMLVTDKANEEVVRKIMVTTADGVIST